MKFGTLEYDLMHKKEHVEKMPFNRKKNKNNSRPDAKAKEHNSTKVNEKTVFGPQLPDNWTKPSVTGDASIDETVREIENKLKRTIVKKKKQKI